MADNTTYAQLKTLFQNTLVQGSTFSLYRAPEDGTTALHSQYIVSDALDRVFDYVVGPANPIIVHLQVPQNYLPAVPSGIDPNPLADSLNAQTSPTSTIVYDDDRQTIGLIGLADAGSVIFGGMLVVAIFSVAQHGDGTPMVHLYLQATPQNSTPYTLDPTISVADWTLYNSFPELYTAPLLANLQFMWGTPATLPTLRMATYRAGPDVPAALYFSGEAMLGSAFKVGEGASPVGVGFLFGGQDLTSLSQPVAGIIAYNTDLPIMRLGPPLPASSAPDPDSASSFPIGHFDGVPPTLVSFTTRAIRGFPPNPRLVVYGEAELATALAVTAGAKTLALPVIAHVTSPTNATLLNINLAALLKSMTLSPDEVSGLLNGLKPAAIPPDKLTGIDLSGHTVPLGLAVQLLPNATSASELLSYVSLSVQTTQPWTILQTDVSQLTLDSASISLMLFTPSAKGVTRWMISGSATLDIGRHDGTISAGMSYSSSGQTGGTRILLSMAGGLITVRDILGLFMGGGAVDAPPVALESFSLEIDTRTGHYSGGFKLVSGWSIDIGGQTVQLADVDVELGYLPPITSAPAKLSGYLAAHPATQAPISGAYGSMSALVRFDGLFEGAVFVRADYPGRDAGWNFSGLAKSDQTIGQLLANIGTYYTLDTPHLPAVIADLALTEVRVTFNTHTGNFTFTVQAAWLGDDADSARLTLHIRRTKQTSAAAHLSIQGTLAFYDEAGEAFEFGLLFDQSGRGDTFAAYYNRPDSSDLSVYQVIKQLVGDSPSLQDETSAFSFGINEALLAYTLPSGAASGTYIFGFGVAASLDLSALQGLPIIGDLFADAPTLDLGAQLMYATAPVSQQTLSQLNRLFKGHKRQLPAGSTNGLPAGCSFSMQLWVDGQTPQTVPLDSAATPAAFSSMPASTPPTQPAAQTGSGISNGVVWFAVQKTFGPLHISRVGFTYKRSEEAFYGYIDADISVDVVTLSLIELYLGFAFGGDGFDDIRFGLNGLGLQFRLDPISIGGSFYQTESGSSTSYNGYASLGLGPLQLSAIGSFAEAADSHPSLFIFAALDYPLGGLGFFFVNGLSAGFGFNRDLIMPAVSQVPSYWLIQAASTPQPNQPPPQTGSLSPSTTSILNSAIRYAPVSVGQYWLALGLRFTTYEIIQTLAVAALSFGKRFEVDVIGLSTLMIPPTPGENFSPLGEAQLALIGSFVLQTDPFAMDVVIQGQLTPNSYLFSRSCKLTGGFAFGVWVGGEHGGDFVVTFGGYHPSFAPPSYYPQVPRVGFSWVMSNLLHAQGALYFALTPIAIMAGGSLSVLFQLNAPSPLPSVRASLDVGMDFLINWKPYHYQVDTEAEVDIDVIFHAFGTHEVAASAGADLSLWGPNWGGHASLHMSIWFIKINFSVTFGANNGGAAPLTWAEFQSALLPQPEDLPSAVNAPSGSTHWNYVTAEVSTGLVRQTQVTQDGEARNYNIIDPKTVVINTGSVIPITSLDGSWTSFDGSGLKTDGLGITPMNTSYASAPHTLRIDYYDTHAAKYVDAGSSFAHQPIARSVPVAMWGTSLLNTANPNSVNQPSLIPNTVGGFCLTPATPVVAGQSQSVPRKNFAYDTTPQSDAFAWQPAGQFTASGAAPTDAISSRLAIEAIQADMLTPDTQAARQSVLNALGFITTAFDLNQDMTQYAAFAPRAGDFSTTQGS
jgi:hypothetical protein